MIRFIFLFFLSLNLSAQTVYRTPSGEKYHLSTCRMVKNVSAKSTVETATKDGLSPCKICKPPFRSTFGIVATPKKTSGESAKNRCNGKTKSGTRCRHFTSIGNKFCFQHLP